MAGLYEHLLGIPPVTRIFLIVTVGVSLGISLDVFDMEHLIFHPCLDLKQRGHLLSGSQTKASFISTIKSELPQWLKLFSTFFVVEDINNNGVRAVLNIYRFYLFSNYLESSRGRFKGNFPDYLWLILVSGAFLVVINWVIAYFGYFARYHHSQLVSCITFLWSRTAMNSVINFLGIVPIKAYYLPLFDLGVAIMSRGPHPADSLAGILAGYIYECIQSDTLPIYNLFPSAYGQKSSSTSEGRRVGFNVDTSVSPNVLTPSIFDLGYWKAPTFFYKLLRYPPNTSKRTTAFPELVNTQSVERGSKAQIKSDSSSNFKGKGRRLGG